MSMSSFVWLEQASPTFGKTLFNLPKELLLEIISHVSSAYDIYAYPTSLNELAKTSHYLYHLIHHDPMGSNTVWSRVFHVKFDTGAIYRRLLYRHMDWESAINRRFMTLFTCCRLASHQSIHPESIDWESIWDMLTENDNYNIRLLLYYRVPEAAGIAFALLRNHEDKYPILFPILSLLANYDFHGITQHFRSRNPHQIVCDELSQFAYHSESESFTTSTSSSSSDQQLTSTPHFQPAQEPLNSSIHLFFSTIFAHHPEPYQAIPGCIPIPLFPLNSRMFDVEYLRRYQRRLMIDQLAQRQPASSEHHPYNLNSPAPLVNRYASTGFSTPGNFITEACQIEGDWIGYYSFQDPDDALSEDGHLSRSEDWFDGPMRLSIQIVPLESAQQPTPWNPSEIISTTPTTTIARTIATSHEFPYAHLQPSPLTAFRGSGIDNQGEFVITGLIDDSEDGQITWEKIYVATEETWEYSGRFVWPMGLCGRWGNEGYGGPWWIWKSESDSTSHPCNVLK